MALYSHGSSSKAYTAPQGKTEFEILKDSHQFLRDGEVNENHLSWEEKLASKYYSSLYREFAVCDLKHYKSGKFALRWRTEDEVLAGTGESTCGNTRCKHRTSVQYDRPPKNKKPALSTLELPFAYSEHGENKSALSKGEEAGSTQELERAAVKGEDLELDTFYGSHGNNHKNGEHSRSPRVDDYSIRSRIARTDRWDREDRMAKIEQHKKRRPRSCSRSPQPQKRSKHR
ncbi:folate-sensitive fragile site protein Fra10Ac1-domain-containing protein [Lentinula aciculospora]|uniref:Folate-sensitive fragile site protein Fra10Ac1-domain-containing protein n=1 Tax=Lentinula aciculospora TaxID=153920 RepID=A0A9W9DMJ8_9AGAR|nr:folate-sensitive fragile site protein Fra10Ac1-domain-containing protein [Lentinula aciculospora]